MAFRPLGAGDLEVLHRWLNEPGVVHWWEGNDVSWPAVVAAYGPDRDDTTEHYLALVDGSPVGWIQCYAPDDDDEDAAQWYRLGVPRSTAGIDYLVGEPSARGTGLGSAMIRAFVDQVVFATHPDWTHVAASPFAANVASCRALEKAGFRFIGTFDDPDGPCSVYVCGRR